VPPGTDRLVYPEEYHGGLVAEVEEGSPAEAAGLRIGDLLVEIDGHPLRDIIDLRFWSDAPDLMVTLRRGGEEHRIRVAKEWGEELGVGFEEPLFDGIRTCRNRCGFCFVKNLPRGLRKSLYIRDDDYRLSFLHGNFVTLSNLSQSDLQRIGEQRLSPLYVSVHATERALRNRLLGVDAPDVLEQIDALARLRIRIHAQVVLCPGINDGPHLDRTIADLAARHESVMSVAVVPVGLTRFHRGTMRGFTTDEAASVVDQVAAHQRVFRRSLGRTFVHLGDELYCMAGRKVPPAAWYDGYPQLDNGVGLVRRLLSSWAGHKRRLPPRVARPRRVGWVCGTSAYPTLSRIARDVSQVEGVAVEVIPVVNQFFGPRVTVSGLLTGEDVLPVLRSRAMDQWVLPAIMFGESGRRTLDDMSLERMGESASGPVAACRTVRGLLDVTLYGSEGCAE